jgi:Uma2 family endonuclease
MYGSIAAMTVSDATYRRLALEDSDDLWELVRGHLRKKPFMTVEHQSAARAVLHTLVMQLDHREFTVGQRVKIKTDEGAYYIPDVAVVPREYVRRLLGQPGSFEVFEDPLPLVLEVWSPPTPDYDSDEKLLEYRRRRDLEVWRIHPYERTLIAWVRQPDGTYTETLYASGIVRPAALPNVAIDPDTLFD